MDTPKTARYFRVHNLCGGVAWWVDEIGLIIQGRDNYAKRQSGPSGKIVHPDPPRSFTAGHCVSCGKLLLNRFEEVSKRYEVGSLRHIAMAARDEERPDG